jgi:hypothetical protein
LRISRSLKERLGKPEIPMPGQPSDSPTELRPEGRRFQAAAGPSSRPVRRPCVSRCPARWNHEKTSGAMCLLIPPGVALTMAERRHNFCGSCYPRARGSTDSIASGVQDLSSGSRLMAVPTCRIATDCWNTALPGAERRSFARISKQSQASGHLNDGETYARSSNFPSVVAPR